MTLLKMPLEITIPFSMTWKEFKDFSDNVEKLKQVYRNNSEHAANFTLYGSIINEVCSYIKDNISLVEPDIAGTMLEAWPISGDKMTFILVQDEENDELSWINTGTKKTYEWKDILNISEKVSIAYTP